MDPNQFQDFLPLVTGFLGGATSAGVFAGPIQTLQDWWYINYGHNVSNQAALLRAKNEIDVENLRNSTLQEVATIPPENIQEPPLKILGPAWKHLSTILKKKSYALCSQKYYLVHLIIEKTRLSIPLSLKLLSN
ncbi:MAG: hypothetical protein ACLS3S_04365 [Streptococcus salivarius]